jgi:phage terminase large subunit-like protein
LSTSTSNNDIQRQIASALSRLQTLSLQQCINPNDLDSRPTAKQEEIFKGAADYALRALVAANQVGKSSVGGREVAWVFENTHPHWKVKSRTRKILVIGRVGEQVETELWRSKIKPFLTPGSYKEVRIGNMLQRVESLVDDAVIIFMSHHNVNEAREKAQSFVLDFVWMDELADSLPLITELSLRVQANEGRMLLTFTPLLRSPQVKKWIEGLQAPVGKVYRLSMLDNPIYAGREAEILLRFKDVPEAERRARLYGEWYTGDLAAFEFFEHIHVQDPERYDYSWRHIEVVDPAASGLTGFMVIAQSPENKRWYVVKAEYIKGTAPSDLLDNLTKKTAGLNIVKRIYDPHETWFYKEALKAKRTYIGVHDKARRKVELIKNVQERLNDGKIRIASWCVDLKEELGTAQWEDNGKDKIAQSTKYHLLDCLQYGIDNLPPDSVQQPPATYDQWLRQANAERKKKEALRTSFGKFKPAGRLGAARGRKWKLSS